MNAPVISLDTFKYIEFYSEVSIWLYQLVKIRKGKSYLLRLLRKGRLLPDKNQAEQRTVYLCCLEQTSHVFLISDLQKYIRSVRKKNINTSSVCCHSCFAVLAKTNINKHWESCLADKAVSLNKYPPPGSFYRFNGHYAMELAPFLAFFDTESILTPPSENTMKGTVSSHEIIAYFYIIIDRNQNVVAHGGGRNIKTMIRELLHHHKKLMTDFVKTLEKKATLTEIEYQEYVEATHCYICNEPFKSSSDRHRHHNHSGETVRDEKTGEVIKSNFLHVLCMKCNTRVTVKRNRLCVYGHSASNYDFNYVINGIPEECNASFLMKSNGKFHEIRIDPKAKPGFLRKPNEVPVYGLSFLDSFSHMSTSLANWVETYKKNNNFNMLHKFMQDVDPRYTREVTEMCTKKGVFPYEYIVNEEKLLENELPVKDAFYSNLRGEHITDEEYRFAQSLFHKAQCKNIYEYMVLYLITDVVLLAQVFDALRKQLHERYNLDPSYFVSNPSFAMQSCLLHSKQKIELISDGEVASKFRRSILGGLTVVSQSRATFNNPTLKSFVFSHLEQGCTSPDMVELGRELSSESDGKISSCCYIDANSLYPFILRGKLPVSSFKELNPQEICDFEKNWAQLDTDGAYCWAVVCDFHIPPELARLTDDLPLGIMKKKIEWGDLSPISQNRMKELEYKLTANHESLIACHEPQKEAMISLQRLQLYTKLFKNNNHKVVVTKIHAVYRFEQKACFKGFIEASAGYRNEAACKAANSMYKKTCNSIFGKFLTNPAKVARDVHLVRTKQRFNQLVFDPFLTSCCEIENGDAVIMGFTKKEVTHNYPTHVGWMILELAKTHMYKFFYQVLKHQFGEMCRLMYTDTDSYVINFLGLDIHKYFNKPPLSEWMDLSGYNGESSVDTSKEKTIRMMGKFKIETGKYPIREVVALMPKSYSVKTCACAEHGDTGSNKSAMKGVFGIARRNIKHKNFVEVHEQIVKEVKMTAYSIRSVRYKLATVKSKKRALASLDRKRYWVSSTESLGFGHPSIVKKKPVGLKKDHAKKKKLIKTALPDLKVDLTYKKSLVGRKIFFENKKKNNSG